MVDMSDLRYPGALIHPRAWVDDACMIGAGTRVWQFASITRGAQIGENCNIAPGATIDGSYVGPDSIIGHNTAMGPGFRLGRGVFVGPSVTFCNDAWPRASKIGWDPAKLHSVILVNDEASIGANCVLLPGITIGYRAMVAAGSVVHKNVPDETIWIDGVCRTINDEDRRLEGRMRCAR